MNKYISSSTDSSKLSTTVSGLIITLSSLIILFASKYGITITTEEISEIASQAGLAVGAITTIYGFLRKILIKVS